MAVDEFGLTPKQRLFADEYIITGKTRHSAEFAGYSKHTASEIATENLNKPLIKSYIDSRRAKIAEKFEITQEYLMKGLKEIHEYNKVEEPYVSGLGKQAIVGKKMRDANASIRAAELLGKSTGVRLFVESKDVTVTAKIDVDDKTRKMDIAKRLLLSLKNPDLLGEIE